MVDQLCNMFSKCKILKDADKWQWSDGTDYDYSDWLTSQPDHNVSKENCVQVSGTLEKLSLLIFLILKHEKHNRGRKTYFLDPNRNDFIKIFLNDLWIQQNVSSQAIRFRVHHINIVTAD